MGEDTYPLYDVDINILNQLQTLPPTKESIKFLCDKIMLYEAERRMFKEKWEKYMKISDDRRRLELQNMRKSDNIRALQSALSKLQSCVYDEREYNNKLQSEIDQFKTREEEYYYKIQRLLKMTEGSSLRDQVIYIFKEPLNLHIGQRLISTEVYLKEQAKKSVVDDQNKNKEDAESSTLDEEFPAINIIKRQIDDYKAKFERESSLANERMDVLKKEYTVSQQEAQAATAEDREKIRSLLKRLQQAETELLLLNNELLDVKTSLRREEMLRSLQKEIISSSIREILHNFSPHDTVSDLINQISEVANSTEELIATTEKLPFNDEQEVVQPYKGQASTSNKSNGKQALSSRMSDPSQTEVKRVGFGNSKVLSAAQYNRVRKPLSSYDKKSDTGNSLEHAHSTGQFIHYHLKPGQKSPFTAKNIPPKEAKSLPRASVPGAKTGPSTKKYQSASTLSKIIPLKTLTLKRPAAQLSKREIDLKSSSTKTNRKKIASDTDVESSNLARLKSMLSAAKEHLAQVENGYDVLAEGDVCKTKPMETEYPNQHDLLGHTKSYSQYICNKDLVVLTASVDETDVKRVGGDNSDHPIKHSILKNVLNTNRKPFHLKTSSSSSLPHHTSTQKLNERRNVNGDSYDALMAGITLDTESKENIGKGPHVPIRSNGLFSHYDATSQEQAHSNSMHGPISTGFSNRGAMSNKSYRSNSEPIQRTVFPEVKKKVQISSRTPSPVVLPAGTSQSSGVPLQENNIIGQSIHQSYSTSQKQRGDRIDSLREKVQDLNIEMQGLRGQYTGNSDLLQHYMLRCLQLEEELELERTQKAALLEPALEKNKTLLEQLRQAKTQHRRTDEYRGLEMEGFRTDIKNLSQKIKDMQKQLLKSILLFDSENKDMLLLENIHRSTKRSEVISDELKRLKAKLYQLESEFCNI